MNISLFLPAWMLVPAGITVLAAMAMLWSWAEDVELGGLIATAWMVAMLISVATGGLASMQGAS